MDSNSGQTGEQLLEILCSCPLTINHKERNIMSDRFDQYMAAMKQLPIRNPTQKDFQSVCPHLTPEQVLIAFTPKEDKETAYVAAPPMRIRHGHLVVSYWGGDKEHEPRLDFAFSHRTLASYADGKPHGDVFYHVTHQEEAMAYAEAHWDDRLILDTWVATGEFYVQDPTDLSERGYPKTKFIVRWTTSRDLNDIMNDWSRPQSEQFDDAIIELAVDEFVGSELKGGRGGYTEFNCAHCGAGLDLTGCHGCGHRFEDNHFRSGWNTPLPRKVVAFLQSQGHAFGKDPEIAWETERRRWEEIRIHYAE